MNQDLSGSFVEENEEKENETATWEEIYNKIPKIII